MNAFVTVDSNWGISFKDSPLATIPSEKRERLKALEGKVAVYGVKYLKELPGNLPLFKYIPYYSIKIIHILTLYGSFCLISTWFMLRR